MPEGEKRGRISGASSNPYYEARKYPEPTVCPRCSLVYRNGRWQSSEGTEGAPSAQRSPCPACRREVDRLPAGLVFLSGEYLGNHRNEVFNITKNQASAAAAQRPLQRIMWIEDSEGSTEIATTNCHLALKIGRAIERACKG